MFLYKIKYTKNAMDFCNSAPTFAYPAAHFYYSVFSRIHHRAAPSARPGYYYSVFSGVPGASRPAPLKKHC